MDDTMGIDISKDTLDAYWLSKRKHKQFANTKIGLSALIYWIRQTEALQIVFEATTARQGMQSMPERGDLPSATRDGSRSAQHSFCAGEPTSGTQVLRRNRPAG